MTAPPLRPPGRDTTKEPPTRRSRRGGSAPWHTARSALWTGFAAVAAAVTIWLLRYTGGNGTPDPRQFPGAHYPPGQPGVPPEPTTTATTEGTDWGGDGGGSDSGSCDGGGDRSCLHPCGGNGGGGGGGGGGGCGVDSLDCSSVMTGSITGHLTTTALSTVVILPLWSTSWFGGRRPRRRDRPSLLSRPVLALIRWYRRRLAPHTRIRCRYEPSCSRYGSAAIERYGLAAGARMAVARIRRCTRDVAPGTPDPLR